ncbi:MAG: hypothetical protein KC729_06915, partial [Candidatus Eisenbacteria bacterium]|nr:hypothetical protein [Candidatus Eisenbacteria bacterium]
TLEVRAGRTIDVARRSAVSAWGLGARWRNLLLTFDENDRNVDPRDPEAHERWEGVIAAAVPGFPGIGSPDCGLLDKRYEPVRPQGPLALYRSEIDGRIHLWGAPLGWIDIDDDGDGVRDARLQMEDRDGNGYFDTWRWDADGDGTFETESSFLGHDEGRARPVPLTFEGLREAERVIAQSRSGLGQAERYREDVRRWRAAGFEALSGP